MVNTVYIIWCQKNKLIYFALNFRICTLKQLNVVRFAAKKKNAYICVMMGCMVVARFPIFSLLILEIMTLNGDGDWISLAILCGVTVTVLTVVNFSEWFCFFFSPFKHHERHETFVQKYFKWFSNKRSDLVRWWWWWWWWKLSIESSITKKNQTRKLFINYELYNRSELISHSR